MLPDRAPRSRCRPQRHSWKKRVAYTIVLSRLTTTISWWCQEESRVTRKKRKTFWPQKVANPKPVWPIGNTTTHYIPAIRDLSVTSQSLYLLVLFQSLNYGRNDMAWFSPHAETILGVFDAYSWLVVPWSSSTPLLLCYNFFSLIFPRCFFVGGSSYHDQKIPILCAAIARKLGELKLSYVFFFSFHSRIVIKK